MHGPTCIFLGRPNTFLARQPASALVIDLVAMPVTIVSNTVAAFVLPRAGPWRCFFVGLFFLSVGFVVYGWWSPGRWSH